MTATTTSASPPRHENRRIGTGGHPQAITSDDEPGQSAGPKLLKGGADRRRRITCHAMPMHPERNACDAIKGSAWRSGMAMASARSDPRPAGRHHLRSECPSSTARACLSFART
ncbi:hypothetical protein C2845_PM11G29760 [Panicum miliaceum]|uniref:Uncharacterized protein n=1 Tax=Panicum miliaceum TaxID=4540 RepID=A0A3L6RQF4_PANMI|nr:hypothetical protein C2845_PM11G29760 [Panicum miliaceum]